MFQTIFFDGKLQLTE